MAKSHEITRAANSLKLSADKIVMLPVSEVRPYEKNPRKNADAVKFVKASIEQFGFKVPIIVDSNRVRAITASSRENETVLDLFGGSGSTLIACEQMNRKCRMVELDPHYCDVIIARWEKFTGMKAEKLEG